MILRGKAEEFGIAEVGSDGRSPRRGTDRNNRIGKKQHMLCASGTVASMPDRYVKGFLGKVYVMC